MKRYIQHFSLKFKNLVTLIWILPLIIILNILNGNGKINNGIFAKAYLYQLYNIVPNVSQLRKPILGFIQELMNISWAAERIFNVTNIKVFDKAWKSFAVDWYMHFTVWANSFAGFWYSFLPNEIKTYVNCEVTADWQLLSLTRWLQVIWNK